jgi:hypothetical protein
MHFGCVTFYCDTVIVQIVDNLFTIATAVPSHNGVLVNNGCRIWFRTKQ